jgi:hypothetical protein
MDKQKYLDDIREIKEIMERSSRFISLSGISGILAGIFGLMAAIIAYLTVYRLPENQGYYNAGLSQESIFILLTIALATLFLAIGAGIIFTLKKAKKNSQKLWDLQTKRLIINLLIPLATGGILCLIMLLKGFIGFTVPFTLIFYGMALVNASKYTFSEIRSLGIMEIILGFFAVIVVQYGLVIWAFGFGILHIVYGIYMQRKYGS